MATTSRFTDTLGTINAGKDNTDRIRNNQYLVIGATAGTVGLKPIMAQTLVKWPLSYAAPGLTIATGSAYVGDKLDILFIGDATGRTVNYSNGISPVSSSQVVAITKTSTISFVFDGTGWVEVSRTQGT